MAGGAAVVAAGSSTDRLPDGACYRRTSKTVTRRSWCGMVLPDIGSSLLSPALIDSQAVWCLCRVSSPPSSSSSSSSSSGNRVGSGGWGRGEGGVALDGLSPRSVRYRELFSQQSSYQSRSTLSYNSKEGAQRPLELNEPYSSGFCGSYWKVQGRVQGGGVEPVQRGCNRVEWSGPYIYIFIWEVHQLTHDTRWRCRSAF